MNIQPKNKKATKYISVSVIIVAVLCVVGFFVWNNLRNTSPQSDKIDGNQQQNDTKGGENKTEEKGTEDNPVRDEPVSKETTAQLTIPNHRVDGASLLLNVAISKPWSSNASCTLKGTGPTVVNMSEPVFAQAQIAGCQFTVDNLKPGKYTFTVSAENESEKTNSETITVTIES